MGQMRRQLAEAVERAENLIVRVTQRTGVLEVFPWEQEEVFASLVPAKDGECGVLVVPALPPGSTVDDWEWSDPGHPDHALWLDWVKRSGEIARAKREPATEE